MAELCSTGQTAKSEVAELLNARNSMPLVGNGIGPFFLLRPEL
jgi:hypothetical protein